MPPTVTRSRRSGGSLGDKSRETSAQVVRHPASLPGSSDAGAHLTSYCGVDFSTRLLAEYADTDVLVIGTHFAPPCSGRLVSDGDGYRFEATTPG